MADPSAEVFHSLDAVLSPSFRILYAPNGPIALRLARLIRPAIVIADVTLPAKDGIQVLQEIRRDHEVGKTRVILWSAQHDPDRIRRFTTGCEPCVVLSKNGDLSELCSKLSQMVPIGDDAVIAQGDARVPTRCFVMSAPAGSRWRGWFTGAARPLSTGAATIEFANGARAAIDILASTDRPFAGGFEGVASLPDLLSGRGLREQVRARA